jgi:hypothetical protein
VGGIGKCKTDYIILKTQTGFAQRGRRGRIQDRSRVKGGKMVKKRTSSSWTLQYFRSGKSSRKVWSYGSLLSKYYVCVAQPPPEACDFGVPNLFLKLRYKINANIWRDGIPWIAFNVHSSIVE